jgi:hypothetical protein
LVVPLPVSVIWAAGMTAPESSVIVPRSVPNVCWAMAHKAMSAAANKMNPVLRKLTIASSISLFDLVVF